MTAQHIRLTGRAAQYLRLVQDLGHLDEEGVARLLLSIGARFESDAGVVLERDDLRRAIALALFERSDGTFAGSLLNEDWPLLFS